jgi:HNH endonuclease
MSGDYVPISLQRRVRLRAGERCEYCRIVQAGQEATFHVDHVVPRVAGGVTSLENLALACVSCSLRKGARTTVIDPATGDAAQLFHPRLHAWSDHFSADASGRGTRPRAMAVIARVVRASEDASRIDEG